MSKYQEILQNSMAQGPNDPQGPFLYQEGGKTYASLPTEMLQNIQKSPLFDKMQKDCKAEGIEIPNTIMAKNLVAHMLTPQEYLQKVAVDFQLSNHRDWNQPNLQLRQDICDLLPMLYQSGFNTEGFPNLEDYLNQTVGTLPCQSLLRLALDSVFEEFPEISAIQTKVYCMLKCHLSIINHPSITQFDDISLANHHFDRVVGPDFHNVSGTESRPDLSLQMDFNETYYSVFSQAQHQVYRVTERSLGRLCKNRANSCPDIVQQLNRDSDHFSNSNWRYMTANEQVYPDPYYLKNDQQTQTEITHILQVKDIGAQYSSPSDSDDSSSSDLDSEIEGTENIKVAKHYLHRHFASSQDLYTNPMPPHKRFRTSTPEPPEKRPDKEPISCPLKEIINHRPALHIPPVDLTVAPGR